MKKIFNLLLLSSGFYFSGFGQTVYNDPAFVTGMAFATTNSFVTCLAQLPDGKLIAGGTFINYNETDVKGLCRLHPDGSLDSSFHFNTSNSSVYAMAVQPDGKLIITGFFQEWDGEPYNGIVRLNANGTIDPGFDPGSGIELIPGFAPGYTNDVEIQTDGKIIVTGQFTSYDGTARKNIARLNSDGSLDTGFDPGQYIDFNNTDGENVLVAQVVLLANGDMMLGGVFDEFNGTPVSGIIRLNGDGTHDNAFNTTLYLDPTLDIGEPYINAITLQPDGNLLIGGVFTEVNGDEHVSMARLFPSGATDNTFQTANDFLWQQAVLGQVQMFALQADGKILVTGAFDFYDNLERKNLLRLLPDGSTDYGFNLEEMGADPGDYTRAYGVYSLSNTSLILVGDFISVQGEPHQGITKLNACGSFSVSAVESCGDYTWSANDEIYSESGSYFTTLENTGGCDSIVKLNLNIPELSEAAEICIVGLDSLTNHNRIVWEKPVSDAIDSFYVYKESNIAGVYNQIGATDYDDAAGLFIDENSDPTVQAYRYKIAILDSCGRITELSNNSHKTIHLTINQGIGNSWNLIWTAYEGITVPTYNIYRGTDLTNITLLTSVSGSMSSYTDLNAPADVFYQVEFVSPEDCDPAKQIDYNSSRSNISTNTTLGMGETQLASTALFPNPAAGEVTIELPVSTGTVTLFSTVGTKVIEKAIEGHSTTLDVQNLSPGMYTVVVESAGQRYGQRLVKL